MGRPLVDRAFDQVPENKPIGQLLEDLHFRLKLVHCVGQVLGDEVRPSNRDSRTHNTVSHNLDVVSRFLPTYILLLFSPSPPRRSLPAFLNEARYVWR